MKKSCVVFIGVIVALLSGCATIVSGSSQAVNVQAIDENTHQVIDDAKCTITDAKNVVYPLDSNPGSVLLPRVYGDLIVNCVAPNYWQKSVGGGSSFNAWTLGNIIFFPGAIVDAATGAAKKYPSHITVLMSTKPVKEPVNKVKAS